MLKDILNQFSNRTTYTDIDKRSLEQSRALASGKIADKKFDEWAGTEKDPSVYINYVKTYITIFKSQLAANPMVPVNDELRSDGEKLHLGQVIADRLEGVLNDGFDYLGVGMSNGTPIVKPIDARYILFNGEDRTLRDSTDVVVFEVRPNGIGEDASVHSPYPVGFVDFDSYHEHIITSHYHKAKDGWILDIYDDAEQEKPVSYPLTGLDRVPIIRFTGERYELEDKRFHYRGLYYATASVLKALCLSATKMQIRCATQDDANYLADSNAIGAEEDLSTWQGVGVRTFKNTDPNNNTLKNVVQPLTHDNQFLATCYSTWKQAITDMLGPVVQSGSDAATREEVIARNQVRDAIVNSFMLPLVEAVQEVYRVIAMFKTGDTANVILVGGFVDNARKTKKKGELEFLYAKMKESGMNTTGVVQLMIQESDIEAPEKMLIMQTMQQDPMASPQVMQLKQQLQQAQQQIQQMNLQMSLMKAQSSWRNEYRTEYVKNQREMKNNEISLEQWKEEHKDMRDAYNKMLDHALSVNDMQMATSVLALMRAEDKSVLLDQETHVANQVNNINENAANNVVTANVNMQGMMPQQPNGAPVNFNNQQQRTAAQIKALTDPDVNGGNN